MYEAYDFLLKVDKKHVNPINHKYYCMDDTCILSSPLPHTLPNKRYLENHDARLRENKHLKFGIMVIGGVWVTPSC